MFSHRSSSGFCCFAMKRPLQKLKGNVLCLFEKPQRWMWGLVVQRLFVRISTVFGSLLYNEAGRIHIGWVCWCSQITYCWEVGNVGAIPGSTAVVHSAHNSRVLWHDVLRRDLRGSLTEGSGVVGKLLLLYYLFKYLLFTTIVRICLIKMEVVSVKFAWFREWYMRWKCVSNNGQSAEKGA